MPLFTTYIGNTTFLNGAQQADASDTAQSALIAGLDVGTIVRNGKAEATFRVIVDGMSESMAEEGGFNQNDWQTRSGGNIIHGPGSYYFADPTITQCFENILKGNDQAAWAIIKDLTLSNPDNPPVMWQFTDPWDRVDQVHLVVHFKKFMSQNLDSQTGWSIEDFTGFLADYNQGNPTPWTGPLYYLPTSSGDQAQTNAVPVSFSRLGRNVTVTSVDLNGSGSNYAVVSPGQNVTLAVEGNIQDTNTSCPGCVTQIYFRLSGVMNLCVSNSVENSNFGNDAYYHFNSNDYDGGSAKTGKSVSFNAPSTPGDYYINPASSWQYECQNSNSVADTFSAGTIATLRVE